MRDFLSQARLQLLHPKARPAFKKFIEDIEDALNETCRIVQGTRTFPEQDAIFQQGRTTPGKKVTQAPAGSSYHNYGLATDLGIIINGNVDWNFDYSQLLPFMPDGMSWGGNFPKPDRDHFEITYGHSVHDLLNMYNEGDFIPGTQYVNI